MEHVLMILACATLLSCVTTSATARREQTPERDPDGAEPAGELATELRAVLERRYPAQGFMGAALVVLKDADIRAPGSLRGPARVLASTAVGLAHRQHEVPLSPAHSFRYASVSKTYIAMMMVRAHVKGLLRLDDAMTGTFPGADRPYVPAEVVELVPYASQVTLGSLLDHSCSLYDFRDKAFTRDLLESPYEYLIEEQELLAGLARGVASGDAPTDCQAFYSNSNYVVAGMILDRLHGHHHSKELHDILTRRMAIASTYYEKHFTWTWNFDYSELAHSYFEFADKGGLRDVTWADKGLGFASGGLIGTPADLARFYSIVFSDRHPAPMDTLAEKAAFLEIFATPNSMGTAPGNTVEDGYHLHAGELGGHHSLALYSPRHRVAIVVYTNDGSRFPELPGAVADEVKDVLERHLPGLGP